MICLVPLASRSSSVTEFTGGCKCFPPLIAGMLSSCLLLHKTLKRGAGNRKSLPVTICRQGRLFCILP